MTDREKAVLLGQLLALRGVLESAIAQLEPQPDPAECPHPIELRMDLTTMGGPKRSMCRACGAEISATTSTSEE